MKTKLLFIVCVVALASCSTPKYSYKFDYHDYNAGRKDKQAAKEVAANPGPVEIQPEMLVAEGPAVAPETPASIDAPASAATKAAPLTLSKAERKEMVKDFKQTVKKVMKLNKKDDTVQSTKAMDADLKMALIFLIGSVISSILGTIVLPELFYILGAVLVIIAIIYFVRWLMRQ